MQEWSRVAARYSYCCKREVGAVRTFATSDGKVGAPDECYALESNLAKHVPSKDDHTTERDGHLPQSQYVSNS